MSAKRNNEKKSGWRSPGKGDYEPLAEGQGPPPFRAILYSFIELYELLDQRTQDNVPPGHLETVPLRRLRDSPRPALSKDAIRR